MGGQTSTRQTRENHYADMHTFHTTRFSVLRVRLITREAHTPGAATRDPPDHEPDIHMLCMLHEDTRDSV